MTCLFSSHQLTFYYRLKWSIDCTNTFSSSRLPTRERIINPTIQTSKPIGHYQCGYHDHITATSNQPIQAITFQIRTQCPNSVSIRWVHSLFPPITSFSKKTRTQTKEKVNQTTLSNLNSNFSDESYLSSFQLASLSFSHNHTISTSTY